MTVKLESLCSEPVIVWLHDCYDLFGLVSVFTTTGIWFHKSGFPFCYCVTM